MQENLPLVNPTRLGQDLGVSNNPGRLLTEVSATTAPLTFGQEIGAPIVPSATGGQGKDNMETDDVNAVRWVGQPAVVLIEMCSPNGGKSSTAGSHSHKGALLTSGAAKKKRRSGSAKHSLGYEGGNHQASCHQSHLTYLSTPLDRSL